ncbi:hypothetical protein FGO68_gene6014 [Halteria grandinella]|uniref:protein-serine/threonine phosphatase n=1 Tax=Halteria grandinella TaxID=5974 RepID=A0A8J8NDH6_HALGN|nr:hypothetical protein FGO68_gene6014 [Halteria grandinella]
MEKTSPISEDELKKLDTLDTNEGATTSSSLNTSSSDESLPSGGAGASEDPSEFSEDDLKKAEEFKTQGNDLFKLGHFEKALDMYSEAIFCRVPKNKKAVYYSNRAFTNIKLENYAIALFDANEAISCDPTFAKAHYRRGSAHLALNQLAEAIKDFKRVCHLEPQNKDAREKYQNTMKEHKEREFAKCIMKDDERIVVKVEDIVVEDSYAGPRLETPEDITPEWVEKLMSFLSSQKVLHRKFAIMVILRCREIFEKDQSLVRIEVPYTEEITVCGDVHGQFYDLLNIFKINGNPAQNNPYLFNGDFIDRGSFSVEVILTLLAWKAALPKHMFMSRGNHESKNLNKLYGFEGEVKKKYDVKLYDLFSELFCYLPIAHCINSQVLVVHGGLFAKDGVKLEDIAKFNRVREPADEGIMCECLWSDPCDQNGRHPSKRGVGVQFGPDVASRFLDENNLKLLVRSHEVKQEGYEYQKGGKVLTVFSAHKVQGRRHGAQDHKL